MIGIAIRVLLTVAAVLVWILVVPLVDMVVNGLGPARRRPNTRRPDDHRAVLVNASA